MKLETNFFKSNSKYYSTENIEVPDSLEKSYDIQRYIQEHRDDYGHDGMFMVIFPPNPITTPILIQPVYDEVQFADIPDEELERMYAYSYSESECEDYSFLEEMY